MIVEPERIDIKEFRERGYLHELNRRFLHPLGLAMEIRIDPQTGEEALAGVWDYRDDDEGIFYADGLLDPEKAATVEREFRDRAPKRKAILGYVIQPVAGQSDPDAPLFRTPKREA